MSCRKKILLTLVIILSCFSTEGKDFSGNPDFDKYFNLTQEYLTELELKAEKKDIYNFFYNSYSKIYKKSYTCFSYGKKGYFLFDEHDRVICFDYTLPDSIDNEEARKNWKRHDREFYEKIIKRYVKILRPDIDIEKLVSANHFFGDDQWTTGLYYFRYYKKTKDGDVIYNRDISGYMSINGDMCKIGFYDINNDISFDKNIDYETAEKKAIKTVNRYVNSWWDRLIRGKAEITIDKEWIKTEFPFFGIENYRQPVVVYANMLLYSVEKSQLITNHLRKLPEHIKKYYRPFDEADEELNLLRKVYIIPVKMYLNENEKDFTAIYIDVETGEIVGGRK